MRIGGLASGMDTEQMVRDLMRAERVKMNKFLRQEQTLKWRQEAYNDVNRIMANFILNTRREFGLTQVSTNGTIRQNASNSLNWIKVANSSNEGAVTATARGNAVDGNHTVEVLQLASNATISSGNINSLLDENQKFTVTGNIKIETHLGYANIDISTDKSINEFISEINNQNIGVRAAYDKDLGQFIITTRETGKDKFIRITDNSIDGKSGLMKDFFIENDINRLQVANNDFENGVNGKDSRIKFNNSADIIEKPTNNFSIFGIDLSLRSTGISDINIGTNVDGIFNQIKSFISSYNDLVDHLNGKINEKQHRSFQPLVQEEKDAMSEKDIDLWEEKAKSGLLRNDEALTRTLQRLRTDLYKPVKIGGVDRHITEFGISTGNFRDGGKLVINEDRLREAISNDPEGVMDLFFKAPASDSTDRTNDSGLVQRLYDGLVTGMKDVVRRSGTGEDASLFRSVQSNLLIDFVTNNGSISVLDRDLMGLNNRIAREERILSQREDRYWRQFSAMEKALGQMQQQSMWIMSQMMGGM